ncbi:hypothetical protein GCM10023340_22540 [Nocardioides marinquilinus]|uniref:Peptidase M12B domain-containing protein n=1 Tax=Nocardioides marinquilinus TaxID=1210400 RepID=A0ABP9PLC9_9ACTN
MRSRLLPSTLAPALAAVVVAAVLSPLPSSTAAPSPGSPAAAGVWTPVDDEPTAGRGGLRQRVDPTDFAAYHLDLGALEQRLAAAPSERRAARGAAPATVAVPSPDGELVDFAIAESPVMQRGLAAAHPEITTWAGTTTGGTPASIRLDVTPMGFHASVRGPGATWYVDPAYTGADQGDDALYLSYRGSDLPPRQRGLTGPDVLDPRDVGGRDDGTTPAPRAGEGPGQVAVQRTYRLALASDPSYAAAFGAANVTAEKVTLVNRLTQVYGDDLSIRLLLVDGNDRLNFNTTAGFLGANGRCGVLPCYTASDVGCFDTVIDTNREVLGQVVGADAYDVGHIVFGADGDGGGLAYLASVGTEDKAGGCTGLDPPIGDGFAIDYVAHELGHQFAAEHTFNGTAESCADDNREATTSVEPGSGSTIMGYAGICGIDDLQPHSDPVFGQRSQQHIADYTVEQPLNVRELQSVALTGFGAGDSFRISYGATPSRAVTFGSSYTLAGLKTALEEAEPSTATATVAGLRGAETLGPEGFTVRWSTRVDIARPTVAVAGGSLDAIVGTIDNGGPWTNRGYANPAPTGNRNPVVTAPADRTIPPRTPFELTGSGTDPDGDALVYTWEQNDPGFDEDADRNPGTPLNSNTKDLGPLFRVFGTYAPVTPAGSAQYGSPGANRPGTSPSRSFPDLAQVVAGATNADTGTCPPYTGTGASPGPALDCFSEFLPRTARTMTFRLTARDLGGANGGPDGGTSYDDVLVGVAGTQPFRVTSQATPTTVTQGATGTVTWDVAGTTAAPVSTTQVRVTLSADGGRTFPFVLLAGTPNDGSAEVAWPLEVDTPQARIRVEAVGNYFYDVNDAPITIAPPAPPTPTLTTSGNADGATFTVQSSDPLPETPTITATSNSVAGGALTATVRGLPYGLDLTPTTTTSDSRTFTVTGAANGVPDTYPVTVTVSDGEGGADDRTVSFTIEVTTDDATVTYTGETASTGDPLTLAATVVDADTPSNLLIGLVVFTDRVTGDELCVAGNDFGDASCTVEVPVARTLEVVATLDDDSHVGASEPVTVVVEPPDEPILAIGGRAENRRFTAASSDPLQEAPTVVATSNRVPGSAITATATGLPDGLSVVASETSGSSRTFTLVGVADADPGEYRVTMTVSDGPGNAEDRTVPFVVAVVVDLATVTYTGDTTGAGGPLTLKASVVDDDAHPGRVYGTVYFTDRAGNESLCNAPLLSGVATCTVPAPANRTYDLLVVLDSVRYAGTVDTATVVVEVDTTPPTARITRGPAPDAIVTTRDVVFEIASEPRAYLTCILRGIAQRCDDGRVTYRDLPAGTHELVVDASDRAGNVDPRAATRRFTVPVDDAAFAKRAGSWRRVKRADAFRGSYLTTGRPGAWLTYRVSRATALSLVVDTGPRRGRVEVLLGDQRLKAFGTTSPTRRSRVVVPVARFGTPRSGLVRVRTLGAAEVQVDGLAVVTARPSGRPAHVSRAGLTL